MPDIIICCTWQLGAEFKRQTWHVKFSLHLYLTHSVTSLIGWWGSKAKGGATNYTSELYRHYHCLNKKSQSDKTYYENPYKLPGFRALFAGYLYLGFYANCKHIQLSPAYPCQNLYTALGSVRNCMRDAGICLEEEVWAVRLAHHEWRAHLIKFNFHFNNKIVGLLCVWEMIRIDSFGSLNCSRCMFYKSVNTY